MSVVANLKVMLGLDKSGFSAGVAGASQQVDGFEKRLNRMGKTLRMAFTGGVAFGALIQQIHKMRAAIEEVAAMPTDKIYLKRERIDDIRRAGAYMKDFGASYKQTLAAIGEEALNLFSGGFSRELGGELVAEQERGARLIEFKERLLKLQERINAAALAEMKPRDRLAELERQKFEAQLQVERTTGVAGREGDNIKAREDEFNLSQQIKKTREEIAKIDKDAAEAAAKAREDELNDMLDLGMETAKEVEKENEARRKARADYEKKRNEIIGTDAIAEMLAGIRVEGARTSSLGRLGGETRVSRDTGAAQRRQQIEQEMAKRLLRLVQLTEEQNGILAGTQ